MSLSVRRLILSTIAVALVAGSVFLFRTLNKFNNALDDIDAMIVTPVSLTPQQQDERPAVLSEAHAAVPTPVPTPVPTEAPLPDSPVTILLMGADQRPKEEATRTDAMVLVHLDRKGNMVSMLSLPRDLWVDIPGYGRNRINAAYPIGEKELGPGGGAALAKATVGELLDLKVDYFVMINFQGFQEVIDLIGGVEIDVPKAIDDPSYPTENYGTIRVRFRQGKQRLNGERALIYARTRHGDSDFGRNQRQQQVLVAIFEQVRRQGLLSQLDNIDSYTGALRDYIRTDMSRGTMLQIGRFAQQIDMGDVQRFAIDSEIIYNLAEPATFAADPEQLALLVRRMTGTPSVPAGGEEPEGN
jgi:polyisoprenyl-teichoic acid--peptidoglycan teichoic acid transferase